MKIGILTFTGADNYGALLQNYALIHFLQNNKIDAQTINIHVETIEKPYEIRIMPEKRKNIYIWAKMLIENIIIYPKMKNRKESFEEFRKLYLRLSDEVKKIDDIENMDLDVFIVGSDQVWNQDIVKTENMELFTLGCVKSKTKISYAASAGSVKCFSKEFGKRIKNLNYVSVREQELKEELICNYAIDADVVVDPVFLLSKEEWNEVIPVDTVERKKYVLVYYIERNNKKVIKIAQSLAQKHNLQIVNISGIDIKSLIKGESYYGEHPLNFMRLIRDAEFVVASSFHAMAFSVIFQKNFWIVPHEKTSSRMLNFLDNIGLSERLISTSSQLKDEEINYQEASKLLEQQILFSKERLLHQLNLEK